jgi:hypothetical protein
MNKLIKQAIEFATLKHEGQFRKVTGLPYVSHPIEVSLKAKTFLEGYGTSEKVIEVAQIVAILHDTLEDTNTTYDELVENFGSLVADQVKIVTKQDGEDYFTFLKRVYESNQEYAIMVKFFDMAHNLEDGIKAVGKNKVALYQTWSYFLEQKIYQYDFNFLQVEEDTFDGIPHSKFGKLIENYIPHVSIGFGDDGLGAEILYLYYATETDKQTLSKGLLIELRKLGVTVSIEEIVTGPVLPY